MTHYFGRKCTVTVGQPGRFAVPSAPVNPIDAAAGPNAIRIESTASDGLRVNFKVEKTLLATPNKCEIGIHNLSEATRGLLTGGQTTDVPMVLEAGYDEGGTGIIFAGHALSIDHARESLGWVTKIRAASGHLLNNTEAGLVFAPGTLKVDVLKAILGAAKKKTGVDIKGAAVKLLKGDAPGALDQVARGLGISGAIGPSMDRIAKEIGLRISEQDGEIVLLGPSDVIGPPTNGLILSADTGLIGSPEIVRDSKIGEPVTPGSKKVTTTSKVLVVKAKCLLSAVLIPGGPVRLLTDALGGKVPSLFRVHKVNHQGDTDGDDWWTEFEAAALT